MGSPQLFPDAVVRRFTEAGYWGTDTVADLVARRAATTPDALAFVATDTELTWADYDRASQQLAVALRDGGLAAGDLVGVFLPDLALTHLVYLALEKVGCTTVGIGPRSGIHEIEHVLRVSRARAVLSRPSERGVDLRATLGELVAHLPDLDRHHLIESTDPGPLALVLDGQPIADHASDDQAGTPAPPLERLGPNDLFFVNSTSGTTGRPKCVQHTQNRWFRFSQHAIEAGTLTAQDRMMSALPTPFGFGLWSTHFTPLLLGIPTVLMERWDATEALALLRRHRVTVFAGVTTQLMMLLDALERDGTGPDGGTGPLGDLRVVFTGGEAVPYERTRRFEELTGARVLQFYGSNESGALSCTTIGDTTDQRLRSAGHVLAEMDVRLIDPATGQEIVTPGEAGQPTCWGPLMSPGYHNDPAANRELFDADGRLRMGDLATIDAARYLTVVGRVADIIIRGGTNISATEVEAAVATHPSVELAAVVGMPDATFGERVCAFVVLRPGGELDLDALHDHLRALGLARYNWPERLEVLDAMPISAGEKIAKAELRRLAAT